MVVPHFITSQTLSDQGIHHGFFTRQGGVCQGLQDGMANDLSAGYSDDADPESITENRKRIENEFGLPFVTAKQVHGADVLTVTEPWDALEDPKEADGLATNQPGLALGILTADCGPILFADPEMQVIGACHAGWKGVKAGIIQATVAAMVALGAQRRQIQAVLGPCMDRVSYEVGMDFPDNFTGVLPRHRSYFRPGVARDKLLFDMPRAIATTLEDSGIRKPEILNRDTFVEKDLFFSYRRATQNGQASYGRQISLIGLK